MLRPSSAPSSRPTSLPSSTPRPHAWFYDTFMDFKSITYIVMYSITAFLLVASILVCCRSDVSIEGKKEFLSGMSTFNFLIWSTFHLVMLCARFNFWLNNDNKYLPYEINASGGIIWVDPNTFFNAGKSTLKNFDCKYSSNHPQGYSPVVVDSCQFLYFNFSLFLMKEGQVKFSIGCGLILYIIYQITIIFIEHAFDTAETPHEAFAMLGVAQMTNNEHQESSIIMQRDAVNNVNHQVEGTGMKLVDKILVYLNFVSPILTFLKKNGIMWLLKYIITTLINCQQSLVLLPLTNMNTNDFCVQVFTPVYDETAVCLYKYATYALPNGIIYALYGVIGVYLLIFCGGFVESDERNGTAYTKVCGICCLLVWPITIGTAFCAFISAAFLTYYFFAGFFLGLWFQFGVYYWTLQTSRPEFLSVSLFIVGDILWAIVDRMD
eukprot:gene37344-48839_t